MAEPAGATRANKDSDDSSDDSSTPSDLQSVLELKANLLILGDLNEKKDMYTARNKRLDEMAIESSKKLAVVQEYLKEKLAKEVEAIADLEDAQREDAAAAAEIESLEAEILAIDQETARIHERMEEMKRDESQKKATSLDKKRAEVQNVKAEIATKKQAKLWVQRDRTKLVGRLAEMSGKQERANEVLQKAEAVAPDIVKLAETLLEKGLKMTKGEKTAFEFLKTFKDGGGWHDEVDTKGSGANLSEPVAGPGGGGESVSKTSSAKSTNEARQPKQKGSKGRGRKRGKR